ncbi:GH3 auxin-responsive promoter [Hygrophoropsis aurantiaca]|uniref:GH3 auxin-responsive promoter n=1 Tax=Hygrophoropsis aurantiaca TaxID=72124 RepID=A0ACB8AJZ3_9AGAM|nr:GH3 auxin-responsive promoter [Hygrophoropsis aurantiaca]
MTFSSSSPAGPIAVLTPALRDALRARTEGVLARLVSTNMHTHYARESDDFYDFRQSAQNSISEIELLSHFRAHIPLTTYASYEPFIERLLNPSNQCDAEDVTDLFAPGLPYFIAVSSATSGPRAKFFAKYRHPPGIGYESVDKSANPTSDSGGKNCIVYSLNYRHLVTVTRDGRDVVARMPVTLMSSGSIRMQNGMDVDKDPWMIHLTAPRATSPVAVSYVRNYRSFLLMHALFALADPMLETINTLFGTVFLDLIRYIEEEWDALLSAIHSGSIPPFDGVDHVRSYLEPKFSANPDRAAALRAIGIATAEPGWLVRLWPRLKVVVGIASGVFASAVPKMRHYLGPTVLMRSLGFTASETYIGTVYEYDPTRGPASHDAPIDPANLNLFKVVADDVIEYLPYHTEDRERDSTDSAANLVSAWDLRANHKYEIVVTTRDGMWRYRLGDIIEVAGFDPTDGGVIVRYVERRNVALRIGGFMTSEKQLADAIFAAQTDTALGPIVEFTVVVDDRVLPARIGYVIELGGEEEGSGSEVNAEVENRQVEVDKNDVNHTSSHTSTSNHISASNPTSSTQPTTTDALSLTLASLARANPNFKRSLELQTCGPPTIRVLRPGTFRDFRRWRIEGDASGVSVSASGMAAEEREHGTNASETGEATDASGDVVTDGGSKQSNAREADAKSSRVSTDAKNAEVGTGVGAGQVKVPVVLWDEAARTWMLERVVKEVGVPHSQ